MRTNDRSCNLILLISAFLLTLVFILFVPVTTVFADEATPEKDDGCIACHESLYYLHDTGKYFCLCAKQMSCTCCHGGNPQSLDEEEAHTGMVLYPTSQEAITCQQCHRDDYQTRVETFSEVAGIHEFHKVSLAIPSSPSEQAELIQVEFGDGLVAKLLEPWRLTGLILAVIGMVIIMILGYRCWKADCLAKLQGR
jgi:hypothetical protein